MIVRRINSMTDVFKMVELGAEMHAESRFRHRPYLPKKLEAYGHQYLNNPTAGVGILAEEDGKCHGIMAGFASRAYFSDDLCAKELVLYVRKEKRTGATAMRLIREFERWAKEIGASEIQVGVSANITDEKATRLYYALGYGDRGTILAKEL